jgi:dihydrofolate reductase
VAKSIPEVLEMTKNDQELMICGGASVYRQFLPLAHRLYLTHVHQSFEGDTFFPEFNKTEWKEISREDHQPDDPSANSSQVKNKYAYSFVVLEKI